MGYIKRTQDDFSLKVQDEMFNILVNAFTPGAKIEKTKSSNNVYEYFVAKKGLYEITNRVYRFDCTVKENGRVLFELHQIDYVNDKYKIATRGMYLKHLDLNKQILEKINNSLEYNERFDMKHAFAVSKEDLPYICKCYINRSDLIDNHLIKHGQIENSTKHN